LAQDSCWLFVLIAVAACGFLNDGERAGDS